jgi:hypothetical protein
MEYECSECLSVFDDGEVFTGDLDKTFCPDCGSYNVEPIEEDFLTKEDLEEAGEDMDECDFIN